MSQKILIVDDDLYLRELYEEVIKDAGYEVETATNGEDGLQKIKTTPYNLILLDVMMPKLDGLGVLAKIKEDPTYTFKTPIMLLTNLAHDPAIQNAVQQGAIGFLIKADLSPDQLVAKIKPFVSV